MRVIVTYEPYITRKAAVSATIAQQRIYGKIKGQNMYPRKLSRHQLVQKLQSWRTDGEKVILMINASENLENGSLARMLRKEETGMQEMLQRRLDGTCSPTFIKIDGIWTTADVQIDNTRLLPFHFEI